jgi:hypothetical protein
MDTIPAQVEVWLPVVGYEGLYEVSDRGRVRRVTATHKPAGHILSTQDSNGYRLLVLCKDAICRRFTAHSIVMAAFVGPCPEGREINHIDGVKSNNHLPNLEYVTRSENHYHAIKLGLKKPIVGESNPHAKLCEKKVREIFALKGKLPQREIAKIYRISFQTVGEIHRGNIWKHLNLLNNDTAKPICAEGAIPDVGVSKPDAVLTP